MKPLKPSAICLPIGWVLLLALLIGLFSPAAASGSEKVLARVEVTGMLDDIDLPVYAHLQGSDGGDYALVIASMSDLTAGADAFTILDQPVPASGSKCYLIALERIAGARRQAAGQVNILHDDGRRLIVSATPAEGDRLVELGFEIAWLSDSPMLPAASTEALFAQVTDYNPDVAAMISGVTADKVTAACGNLSGENQVQIGGVEYEIYSRNTNNATWMQRSTQYVYEQLQALGIPVAYHNWSGTKRNVVGELSGGAKSTEIILVTAHLDDMPSSGRAPGADDNASGSVGVLLAAEIMKAYEFERTVRFVFFTGEEQGLYGSAAYAQKVEDAGEDIVAVLNMDMIGWDDVGDPILRLHTRTPSNPGYPADKAIADVFIDVVSLYGMENDLAPLIDPDGIWASDHSSFWNKGFAAILAIEDDQNDFNDYYHTSSDTLDKLNIPYFTYFVKASLGTTAHLAEPVAEGPQAAFGSSVDGKTVAFTDASACSSCTLDSWSWDFGDGAGSSEQNPVHTYSADGVYPVKLTVGTTGGQSDSVTQNVTVGQVVEYCDSAGGSQNYEWIAGVALGGFSKSSGASGYSDYTADVISVSKGEAVSLKLTPGFAGSSYNEHWRVWADLNRDGDFSDTGELLFEDAASGVINGAFTLPSTVSDGSTRLRVSMQYNTAPSACGDFTYGEVEDYTLQIGAGQPPLVEIVSVSTGKAYTLDEAGLGVEPYIDRSYTITAISDRLDGGVLVKTAMDDKYVTAADHLVLKLNAAGIVYVCLDKRAGSLPDFLDSWTLTNETVSNTAYGMSPQRVYSQSVAAGGQITLGGNYHGGSTGSHANYFVVVQPQTSPVEIVSVSTGKAYTLGTAELTVKPYIDRGYTITSISAGLNGGILVKAAMDDKYVTAADHLVLHFYDDATVYVAYDKRAKGLPDFLDSWTLTSESLSTTDTSAAPLRVYRKAVAAGTDLTLGGNHQGGDTGARSNYLVIVP